MSTPPQKFDEATFRREMSEPAKYLLATWKMAVELAEQGIAPPPDPDDGEARNLRQRIVFELAGAFFEKMTSTYGR